MIKNVTDGEELKISDRLSIQRTIRSEGRSLLAWVRTSLSLIGFGFTIFKALQYVYQQGLTQLMHPQTPRNIGIFMILTGTVPLLLAIILYVRETKRLGQKGNVLLDPNFIAAAVIFLFGSLLALSIVLNIRLL